MAFVNGWSSTRAEGSHYKDIGKGGKRNIRSHSELNLRENIQYDPVKILPSTSTPSLSKPCMHGEKGKGTSNMSTWCHIPFGGPLKGGENSRRVKGINYWIGDGRGGRWSLSGYLGSYGQRGAIYTPFSKKFPQSQSCGALAQSHAEIYSFLEELEARDKVRNLIKEITKSTID
ncbi:hypothetical protein JHK87_024619 [Glycine soja]|nr:hypothetical protein JHK87_024619 [Glycine soja]